MPRTDTFIEKESSVNEQIDRMRHAATRSVLERDDVIIVSSVSCIYGIGSVETYTEMTLMVEVGQEIKHTDVTTGIESVGQRALIGELVALHYRRNDMSFERGNFRVRGDVIELWPPHLEDRAWRFSLFGDEIDKIFEFDPLTGEKIRELERLKIYANSHYVTPRPTLHQAMEGMKVELKTAPRRVGKSGSFAGISTAGAARHL